MPKRKRQPPFWVYGTADHFKDRSVMFRYGMHTIDRRVNTKREALELAHRFMFDEDPKGPKAYVLIEKRTSYGTVRFGAWNSDNWGTKSGEMQPNRRHDMRRNADSELQTYIVEFTRTDSDDYTHNLWGIYTCEPTRYENEYDLLMSDIKERFVEEVFSEEVVEKGDTPEKVDDRAIYHMWTDWDAYSQDELDEMSEEGEEPENSTELVAIQQMIPVADDDEIAAYEEKHGEPTFEYDSTE